MKKLEEFLKKVLEDKIKEREKILKEAELEKGKLRGKFKKEAESYFKAWEEKEKKRILREKQQEIFKAKLEKRRIILEEKEKIVREVYEKAREGISGKPDLIPSKKVIEQDKELEVPLSLDEFLGVIIQKTRKEVEDIIGKDF